MLRPLFTCLWLLGLLCSFREAHADQMDDYLRAEMAKHHIPGLAVTVVRVSLTK